MLFGDSFAKEAKEREEQLRCLHRASDRGRQQDFHNGRPQTIQRGGGTHHSCHYQTRGRGRFQPYSAFKPTRFPGKENYQPKGRGKTQ